MVFIPGHLVNIEDERIFADGEEIFSSEGQNVISEGTNGAGDVVIGNFDNSNFINNEESSSPNPDLSENSL